MDLLEALQELTSALAAIGTAEEDMEAARKQLKSALSASSPFTLIGTEYF